MNDKRIRIERKSATGEWEAYTAWCDAKRRADHVRWLHRQKTEWDVNNSYRMVEED